MVRAVVTRGKLIREFALPHQRMVSALTRSCSQNGRPRGSLPPGRHVDSAKGPVSRILSCAVIPLGAALPRTLISDLPGGFGNCSSRLAASGRCAAPPGSFAVLPSLFGLAPCGVYPAPALQTERCALTAPFHPYPGAGVAHARRKPALGYCVPGWPSRKRGSRGGIFSVALAVHGP